MLTNKKLGIFLGIFIAGYLVFSLMYNSTKYKKTSEKDNISLEGTSFERVPGSDVYVYTEPAVYLGDKVLNYFSRTVITGFRGRLGNGRLYCHFRDQNGAALVSKIHFINNPTLPDFAWDFKYQPVQCECVTKSTYIPVNVSVSRNTYYPGTSFISVKNRLLFKKSPQGVAVCTKQVYKWKSEYTIVEWFEIQKLQGIKQVIMYDYTSVSPKVEKALKHYVKEGILTLQPWILPWNSTDLPSEGGQIHCKGQFASHEDCRYRFGHVYKYFVYIDPDEYILPASPSIPYKYDELISYINKVYVSDMEVMHFVQIYCCTNITLVNSDLSTPYTQMSHNCTEPTFTDFIYGSGKVIIKPHSVKFMGVHGPSWVKAGARKRVISTSVAKLHHYKTRTNCNIKVNAVQRFKNKLFSNFRHVLNLL